MRDAGAAPRDRVSPQKTADDLQASKQASKPLKPASSAARSLAVSAPAMLTAASCGAGTIETAVTSATEAAVVVVVVHIWMKIGTGPVEHLCPRHASHIYGGRGDALGSSASSRRSARPSRTPAAPPPPRELLRSLPRP